jgi:hypothetical protein
MGSYCLLVTATRVPFQEFGNESFAPAVPLLRNSSKAILPCHKAGVGGSRPWSFLLSTVRMWSGCATVIL